MAGEAFQSVGGLMAVITIQKTGKSDQDQGRGQKHGQKRGEFFFGHQRASRSWLRTGVRSRWMSPRAPSSTRKAAAAP